MKHRFICHFLACLWAFSALVAEAAPTTEQDVLYLQIKRSLHEEPDSPSAAGLLFALGEYHHEIGQREEASRLFRQAREKAPDGALALLAGAYLSEAESLKDSLAKKRFVSLFGKTNRQRWTSPLKNEYEIVENVDGLDVRRNGAPFYAVSLP